jgi:hypothetical protein
MVLWSKSRDLNSVLSNTMVLFDIFIKYGSSSRHFMPVESKLL